jgi:hypothetical protein
MVVWVVVVGAATQRPPKFKKHQLQLLVQGKMLTGRAAIVVDLRLSNLSSNTVAVRPLWLRATK